MKRFVSDDQDLRIKEEVEPAPGKKLPVREAEGDEPDTLDAMERASEKVRTWVDRRLDDGALQIARLYRGNRDGLVQKIRQLYEGYLGDEPTIIRARQLGVTTALDVAIDSQVNALATALGEKSLELLTAMSTAHPEIANRWISPLLDIEAAAAVQPYETVLGELTTAVVGGGTYSDRLLNITQTMKSEITDSVRSSLIAGSDFETLRGKIQSIYGVDELPEPRSNAYGSVQIYRNEARRQWNGLMQDLADRNEKKTVWSATLDESTTPGCAARHGYALDELDDSPPRHFNCRCELVIIDPDEDTESMKVEGAAWLKANGYSRRGAWGQEAWDPGEHPRDEDGHFASKGTASAGKSDKIAAMPLPRSPYSGFINPDGSFRLAPGGQEHATLMKKDETWARMRDSGHVRFWSRPDSVGVEYGPKAAPEYVAQVLDKAGSRRVFVDHPSPEGSLSRMDSHEFRDGFSAAAAVRSGDVRGWVRQKKEATAPSWGSHRLVLTSEVDDQLARSAAPDQAYATVRLTQMTDIFRRGVEAKWAASIATALRYAEPGGAIIKTDRRLVPGKSFISAKRLEVLTVEGWRPFRGGSQERWVEVAPGQFALDGPSRATWGQPFYRPSAAAISKYPALATLSVPRGNMYQAAMSDESGARYHALLASTRNDDEIPALGQWVVQGKSYPRVVEQVIQQPGTHLLVWRDGVRPTDLQYVAELETGKVLYAREHFPPGTAPVRHRFAVLCPEGGRVWAIRPTGSRSWFLPGGHRDPGETRGAAAVRETLEETGIKCTLEGVLGEIHRPQFTTVVFHGRLLSRGEPTTPDEIEEVALVDVNQIDISERLWVKANYPG